MAAVLVTPVSAPLAYSTTGLALTEVSVDVANGNYFAPDHSNYLLIVRNSGASTRTITVTSVADPVFNRTGHLGPQNVLAGELRIIRLVKSGWADTSGNINFSGSHADLKVSIVKL